MSKEKELLKAILANTNAIMDHLKIKNTRASEKETGKVSVTAKPSPVKTTPAKKKQGK